MDDQTRQRFEARARVLKAMAHPTRLFILDRLSQGPLAVTALAELAEADISTISRHLGQLRQTGVVAAEKRGNQVFYRLAAPCALGFFDCVESVLQTNAARQLELIEPEKAGQ